MAESGRSSRITDWGIALIPAAILAIAIPPKFLADPASVSLFTRLGAEPDGRIATGIFESIAVLLLLVPATRIYGSLLAAGLMSGAIIAHITVLGIQVDGDPSLFVMACAAFLGALAVSWRHRRKIPLVGQWLPEGPESGALRSGRG